MVTRRWDDAQQAALPDDHPLEDLPLAAEGARVMHLLERGVPLTLLIDLLNPGGPDSAGILAVEQRDSA